MRALFVLLVAVVAGCAGVLDIERARALLPRGGSATAIVVGDEIVALPAPRTLAAVDGELRAIPLTWEPVLTGDVAGYVIERALSLKGPFARVATPSGRFNISWVDRGSDLAPKHGERQTGGLEDSERYYYRVRCYRTDGRIGQQSSPIASAATVDAPDGPGGLRAYSHLPRRVALSWRASDDPTVAAYAIQRSPSATGRYQQIAKLSGRFTTNYMDEGLGALRVFYYRVSALNAAGGEGAAGEAVRAVTKPEPLPPAGLVVAERHLGRNVVRWDRNVERDITGYRLLRFRGDEERSEVVGSAGPEQTWIEDFEVGAGERVAYAVLAIDADGLESEVSDRVSVESVAYDLEGVVEGAGVRLRWNPSLQTQLAEARILREGPLGARQIGRAGREATFLDQEVRPGGRYRYLVVGVRTDGSKAPPSRSVEVALPDVPGG